MIVEVCALFRNHNVDTLFVADRPGDQMRSRPFPGLFYSSEKWSVLPGENNDIPSEIREMLGENTHLWHCFRSGTDCLFVVGEVRLKDSRLKALPVQSECPSAA